jgi:hypothetical protein
VHFLLFHSANNLLQNGKTRLITGCFPSANKNRFQQ